VVYVDEGEHGNVVEVRVLSSALKLISYRNSLVGVKYLKLHETWEFLFCRYFFKTVW
jgi:hypothetical protein